MLFDRQKEEFHLQQRKLEQSRVELEAEKQRLIAGFTVQNDNCFMYMYIVVA